jgi:hypothetical protein
MMMMMMMMINHHDLQAGGAPSVVDEATQLLRLTRR